MREIKFRAWDKAEGRMLFPEQLEKGTVSEFPTTLAIGFHGKPVAFDRDSFKGDEVVGWNRDHNLELMQYTGLNDKAGKPVYEGDIVNVSLPTGKPWRIGAVVWHGFGFAIDTDTKNVSGAMPLPASHRIEVIGNIHEHPELLINP